MNYSETKEESNPPNTRISISTQEEESKIKTERTVADQSYDDAIGEREFQYEIEQSIGISRKTQEEKLSSLSDNEKLGKRPRRRGSTSSKKMKAYDATYPTYHDYSCTPIEWRERKNSLSSAENTSSEVLPQSTSQPLQVTRPIRANTFPVVLHQMLQLTDKYDDEFTIKQGQHTGTTIIPRNILRWEDHGRSFVIVDKQQLVNYLCPMFFPYQTEYSSFQRQLNLYGFRRLVSKTTTAPASSLRYYHEMFLRTRQDLCHQISRIYVKKQESKSSRLSFDPESEPNFNSYPPLLPVLESTSTVASKDTRVRRDNQIKKVNSPAAARGEASNDRSAYARKSDPKSSSSSSTSSIVSHSSWSFVRSRRREYNLSPNNDEGLIMNSAPGFDSEVHEQMDQSSLDDYLRRMIASHGQETWYWTEGNDDQQHQSLSEFQVEPQHRHLEHQGNHSEQQEIPHRGFHHSLNQMQVQQQQGYFHSNFPLSAQGSMMMEGEEPQIVVPTKKRKVGVDEEGNVILNEHPAARIDIPTIFPTYDRTTTFIGQPHFLRYQGSNASDRFGSRMRSIDGDTSYNVGRAQESPQDFWGAHGEDYESRPSPANRAYSEQQPHCMMSLPQSLHPIQLDALGNDQNSTIHGSDSFSQGTASDWLEFLADIDFDS